MSAVALNPSLAPWQSSPEPMRDSGRQPSGAFSFSSILNGINQQDAPANGGGSPVGVAESPENMAAGPVGHRLVQRRAVGPARHPRHPAGHGQTGAAQDRSRRRTSHGPSW